MFTANLWKEYKGFADLREVAQATGVLDMQNINWAYPTLLLPLTGFLLKSGGSKLGYRPPADENVASYISLMIENPRRDVAPFKSYIPNNFLPARKSEADKVFRRILDLQDNGKGIGGQSAFAYLVGELIDNIYQHSEFDNAMVMAQRYGGKKFVEVSFYDDGLTIPGSLRKVGFEYANDLDAIEDAINGKSSKPELERGYGLGTNVRMCTDQKGLRGNVLVVSGHGAVGYSFEKSGQYLYNLGESSYVLDGTLISIRIPYLAEEVNVHDFTT
jgi:hypothetical protein